MTTAAIVASTALICAWWNYGPHFMSNVDDADRFRPTLWQFITNPDTAGIWLICCSAGIFALPLFYVQTEWLARERPAWVPTLVSFATTGFVAIFFAVVIAAFHIPWGH
jgi:hypothetical protein